MTAFRFRALKLWAVRLFILALVAAGFFGVSFLIFRSLAVAVFGAVCGGVLFMRAVLRLTIDDIRF